MENSHDPLVRAINEKLFLTFQRSSSPRPTPTHSCTHVHTHAFYFFQTIWKKVAAYANLIAPGE